VWYNRRVRHPWLRLQLRYDGPVLGLGLVQSTDTDIDDVRMHVPNLTPLGIEARHNPCGLCRFGVKTRPNDPNCRDRIVGSVKLNL
jgi:hypothetical protein